MEFAGTAGSANTEVHGRTGFEVHKPRPMDVEPAPTEGSIKLASVAKEATTAKPDAMVLCGAQGWKSHHKTTCFSTSMTCSGSVLRYLSNLSQSSQVLGAESAGKLSKMFVA